MKSAVFTAFVSEVDPEAQKVTYKIGFYSPKPQKDED